MASPARADRPLAVRVVDRLFQTVCATSILAITVVMCWDVTSRYLLSKPLPWSQEVIQALMAVLFFAGLPLATLRREHIVVDILSERLTGTAARVAGTVSGLVLGAYLLVLGWYSTGFAAKLMGYGDSTPWLGLPWHPVAWGAAIAFAAAAVASLAWILAGLRRVAR